MTDGPLGLKADGVLDPRQERMAHLFRFPISIRPIPRKPFASYYAIRVKDRIAPAVDLKYLAMS